MFSKKIIIKHLKPSWPTKTSFVFVLCFLAMLGSNFQEYSNTYKINNTGTLGADFELIAESIVPSVKSYRFFYNNKKESDDSSILIERASFQIEPDTFTPYSASSHSLIFIPPTQGGYGLTYTSRAPPHSLM